MTSATPEAVAKWMLGELARDKVLYQDTTVYSIHEKFGERFTYINDRGNLAIAKPVLAAFTKLTATSVVWERGERCWRFRESHDAPGRQQD